MIKFNPFAPKKIESYDYLAIKEKTLSFTAESFKKVLFNLDFVNSEKKIKVIQFSSTLASEGKTAFISNLAYLMGQRNQKVLLLDLDLRRPSCHLIFNVENKDGLTEYISGKTSYEKLMKHSKAFGFDYILSGAQSSEVTKIIESKKLSDLIEKLKESYDYILLDTPPVIAVSDALFIAKHADGIVFVVAQDVAKKSMVKEAVEALKRSHVPIIGTVLTQVSARDKVYSYDSSYLYEDQ